MNTTRITDRDAFELANGRVPARADLDPLADLLTAYRSAAIGSAPEPSAALRARLDLSATPIAMQRDGAVERESGGAGVKRAARGLLGLGVTVGIIMGAASGAAAFVGAGSAGLLPPGAQDAFDQVVSTVSRPGVVGDETTDLGEAPGLQTPDTTAGDAGSEDSSVGTADSDPVTGETETDTVPGTGATTNGGGTAGNSGSSNGTIGTGGAGKSGSSNGTAGEGGAGKSGSSNGTIGTGGAGKSGSSNGTAGEGGAGKSGSSHGKAGTDKSGDSATPGTVERPATEIEPGSTGNGNVGVGNPGSSNGKSDDGGDGDGKGKGNKH